MTDMHTQTLDYQLGSLAMRGFLAYDEAGPAKKPGVIVVHEAFGLERHVKDRAQMLAKLGYVALAVDMFGEGKQIAELGPAIELITALKNEPATLRARARAGVEALAAQPQVDASKLAAIGFCFGGTTVLELARDGADLAGVVSFHGSLLTPAPAKKDAVKASVLVCTGADDPMIPPAQVADFQEEMRQAGADYQVISYGNTMHSFTNPAADGSMAAPLIYNKLADERSWAAMQSFFAEIFAR
jgi:dienelactone hydrolase